MRIKINNTKKEGIPENITKSVIVTLQKEGYLVKRNVEYPNKISSTLPVKYRRYVLDIFAFKKVNDIVVIKYENCLDVLSNKNKKNWKALSAKPGVDFYMLVPSCCKEKAQLKIRMLNIPVKIICMNDLKDSFKFSSKNLNNL